jgi:TonB family protein
MREENRREAAGARADQAPSAPVRDGTPQFLFSSHYSGIGPSSRQVSLERFLGALGFHLLGLLAIVAVVKYTPAGNFISAPMESIPFHQITWLDKPGPGGGGGGGGNRMRFPPKKANAPIPVAKAQPMPVPAARPADAPPPALDLPAKPNDVAMVIPGATDVAGDALSRGPGSGGGYGTGTGTGIGSGNGSGLGPGWGGGTGGGAYRPGAGITNPTLISSVSPNYTPDAMRARIQGSAEFECVVEVNGTVGECRLIKSLDSVYGLDQEALKAARRFRFNPGRKDGKPVPVIVIIGIDFVIH